MTSVDDPDDVAESPCIKCTYPGTQVPCCRPSFTHILAYLRLIEIIVLTEPLGWLDSRVVSVLDSGAEGPGFKSQPQRCRVTVLGKLVTPIAPLFTKQRNF